MIETCRGMHTAEGGRGHTGGGARDSRTATEVDPREAFSRVHFGSRVPFSYMFQLNDLSLRVRWCGPQSHLLDHRTMFTRSHTMELRIHVCSP